MESDHYVLLWSHSQQATDISTVAKMLEDNLDALLANRPNDFVVLAFATTHESAHAEAERVQALRNKRQDQTT